MKDGTIFAIATGRLFNLNVKAVSVNKKLAQFAVAVDYTSDDFGRTINIFENVIAWTDLAHYMEQFVGADRNIRLLVAGKIQINEYQGKEREQIVADYIAEQPKFTAPIKEKKNKEYDEFDDLPF